MQIDPFSIQDAETLTAAIHHDWGEAQGNYDEFGFFTGLRPSEQIALVVSDCDPINGVLSITKARLKATAVDLNRKFGLDFPRYLQRIALNWRSRRWQHLHV